VPFLASIIGQAESQINNTVAGNVAGVQNAVGIFSNNIKTTVANTAANAVSTGLAAAQGAAIGALTNLATGNIQGAVNSVSNAIPSAFSSLTGLGSQSGQNLQLTEPGYAASVSSSGGVTPGNALLGALARADPMLTFLWYCQLPVVGAPAGGNGAGVNSSSNALNSLVSNLLGQSSLTSAMGGTQYSSSSAQLPWYYVEEASAPFRTFQDRSIFRDGRKRHYPSEYSVNNLRLGFYTDVDNQSMQYLQAWNNAILQPYSASTLNTAGSWGTPAGYKYPIYIYLLDVTKSVLLTLEYTECWPLGIQDYGLSSSVGNERIISHVDFSVGDVFVNLANVPSSITQALVNNSVTNAVVNTLTNGVSTAAQSIVNFL
jgi:hypothetical protein